MDSRRRNSFDRLQRHRAARFLVLAIGIPLWIAACLKLWQLFIVWGCS